MKKRRITIGVDWSLVGWLCLPLLIIVFIFGDYTYNLFRAYVFVKPLAEEYIFQNYPGYAIYQVDASIWNTFPIYTYNVKSDANQFDYFQIYYTVGDNWEDKFWYDTYLSDVYHRKNLYCFLQTEYRKKVEDSLQQWQRKWFIGETDFWTKDYFDYCSDDGLDISLLELDGNYDVNLLGKQFGRISLYIKEKKDVSEEYLKTCLVEFDQILQKSGLGYRTVRCEISSSEKKIIIESICATEIQNKEKLSLVISQRVITNG